MAEQEKRHVTGGEKKEHTGEMTVREAGHKGGEKVRELIEKGEEMEEKKHKGGERAA